MVSAGLQAKTGPTESTAVMVASVRVGSAVSAANRVFLESVVWVNVAPLGCEVSAANEGSQENKACQEFLELASAVHLGKEAKKVTREMMASVLKAREGNAVFKVNEAKKARKATSVSREYPARQVPTASARPVFKASPVL